MKNLIILSAFLLGFIFMAAAQTNPQHVYVNGYLKSNGTYVDGYYRTAPNYTINDNFSTYPNVNPYTGKVGTIRPETYSYPDFSKAIRSDFNVPSYNQSSWPSSSYGYPDFSNALKNLLP